MKPAISCRNLKRPRDEIAQLYKAGAAVKRGSPRNRQKKSDIAKKNSGMDSSNQHPLQKKVTDKKRDESLY